MSWQNDFGNLYEDFSRPFNEKRLFPEDKARMQPDDSSSYFRNGS
jgi:hypothetical protein